MVGVGGSSPLGRTKCTSKEVLESPEILLFRGFFVYTHSDGVLWDTPKSMKNGGIFGGIR